MLSFTAVFNNPLDSFERHGISVGSFEGRVEQHINLASALPRTEVKKKQKNLFATSLTSCWCATARRVVHCKQKIRACLIKKFTTSSSHLLFSAVGYLGLHSNSGSLQDVAQPFETV